MSASTTFSQLVPRAAARCSGGPVLLAGGPAFAPSARVWLVLVAFLAVVQLFITSVGAGLERDPRIGLFAWPMIAAFGLAGLVGIWFSHRTGFPAAWGAGIANRQRIVYPTLVGIAFGLLLVVIDLSSHITRVFLEQMGLWRLSLMGVAPRPQSEDEKSHHQEHSDADHCELDKADHLE